MNYTISKNTQFNSVEVLFDGKPSEEVREALKGLRFRWHRMKGLWYGYASEDAVRAAIEGKAPAAAKEEPKAKANKYGVKVGDLFWATWGYEQTNNNYFQVIALVGESSVRVREVYPECEYSKAVSWASEDRVINTNTNGQILPAAPSSVFIKDQEKGDLKRLKSYSADGVSDPQFNLSSFANAYYCKGEAMTVYESWYA